MALGKCGKRSSRLGIDQGAIFMDVNPNDGSVLCGGTAGTLWRFPIEPADREIPSNVGDFAGFLSDDYVICPAYRPQTSGGQQLALYDLTQEKLTPLWKTNTTSNTIVVSNRQRDKAFLLNLANKNIQVVGFDAETKKPREFAECVFEFRIGGIGMETTLDSILLTDANHLNSLWHVNANVKGSGTKFEGPQHLHHSEFGFVRGGEACVSVLNDPTGRQSDRLICWKTENGQILHEKDFKSTGFALAISNDGQRFAVAGKDASIAIHDAQNFEKLNHFRAHDGAITKLAYHPKLPIIASSSADLTIRLWNTETGEHLKTLIGPSRTIRSLVFNASGTRLACHSDERITRIWNINGESLLAKPNAN